MLLITGIFLLLQTTVLSRLPFAAVTPDIMMVLTVSMGFMQGKKEGLMTGFVSGLFIDLISGSFFGGHAFLYMMAGYFSGFFCQIYFDNSVRLPLMLTGAGETFLNLAIYLSTFLLRGKLAFGKYLEIIILPSVVFTVLSTLVVYPVLYKINHLLVERQKEASSSLWIRE